MSNDKYDGIYVILTIIYLIITWAACIYLLDIYLLAETTIGRKTIYCIITLIISWHQIDKIRSMYARRDY